MFEFTGICVKLTPTAFIKEYFTTGNQMISRNDYGFNMNYRALFIGGDDQCSNLTHFTLSTEVVRTFLPFADGKEDRLHDGRRWCFVPFLCIKHMHNFFRLAMPFL